MRTRINRSRLYRLFIAAAIALSLLFLPIAPGHKSQAQLIPEVIPFIDCTMFHFDTKALITFWGYVSTFSTTVTIPVGDNNFFFPEPRDWNQPTVFEPGIHHSVLVTSFVVDPSGMQQLSWLIRAGSLMQSATTRNDPSLYCSTGGLPGPPGPQGPQGSQGLPGSSILSGATTVTASAPIGVGDTATASCPAGYVLLTGGGECTRGSLLANGPVNTTQWRVKCSMGGGVTAKAICVPIPSG
jgi:hypothetical protein